MEDRQKEVSPREVPEEMASFFDNRAEGYDAHMKNTVQSFKEFYSKIAAPMDANDKAVKVLDLGCGTGLELEWVLKKAPDAQITGVDMSEKMIETLYQKYESNKKQINCIVGSYLKIDFGKESYDYVISAMTMHHLKYEEKKELYSRIKKALKPGGLYIEGDYTVNAEDELACFREYDEKMTVNVLEPSMKYHIDIPFSLENQKKVSLEAGFREFNIIFEDENSAVYVMYK